MAFVQKVATTIRGEKGTLHVYESFGEHDQPTRIVFSSAFPGKSDKIMIVFAGPIASWDQKVIGQFIASIE